MENQPGNKESTSQFLEAGGNKTKSNTIEIPSITLPKGGGAIKGIDEKFSVNAVNGTASFSIPIPFSPSRGVTPAMNLSYNSGAGNDIFGLGWSLGLPSIKRKTDTGLPQYFDAIDSDTFLFSGVEDLVPEFKKGADGKFTLDAEGEYIIKEKNSIDGLFTIRFYKPGIEDLFSRIERWSDKASQEIKWRVITKDNIITLLGWSADSRIAEPGDPRKIFEWLPEFVFDDKGNCAHYIYKKEDDKDFDNTQLHNSNRVKDGSITYTNLYLDKVLYGNKIPYKKFGDAFPAEPAYLFSAVFDYGTLQDGDTPDVVNDWDFRKDAFSNYKAGFEIRTTRLCKRVLIFHHFTGPNEYNGLVRSLNFEYDSTSQEDFTFLKSATSFGYIKNNNGSYSQKNLPAIEFTYQKHEWNKEVKTISPENVVHAPAGLDEQQYQFTDLYNEGLPGILTEQGTGWYYKHNLGDGKFSRTKLVTPKPSFTGLGSVLQLADLDADGGKQLVSLATEPKGYFELDDNNEWQSYRNFETLPNINFADPNTRMLDLNGDGKPELFIDEDDVFSWYASEGRNGFSQGQKTVKPFDEEAGPHIVFAEETQTVFLADMSGDGLTDIVRIRNGEVCYWPNLGYGKFGAKVSMDNAPWFDNPDTFNSANLRLADIDGSGTTDIIYLEKNKFTCWMNLSGNGFHTSPFEIDPFPEVNTHSKITVIDLLGNGVSCIVWSSALSKNNNASIKYVDLMNSKKPHLMVFYKNNFGKEVSLEYSPSTKFYLEDKFAGRHWATKLHFPVHCISKTETTDKITGHRFVSSYKYHHGYYDHPEREFRGFGMVEQTDTEDFEHWAKGNASNIVDKELHQEPMVLKSWFHTGAFLSREKILNQFAYEYWYEEMNRQGFTALHHEFSLPDARLIPSAAIAPGVTDQLSVDEWREALRACKGMNLRTEVFAKDAVKNGNTPGAIQKELTPYTVVTHNYIIELLQPQGKNKHAIFVVKESEAITYSYERSLSPSPGGGWGEADPRIAHSLNIQLDEYGNVLESALVVYPRLSPDVSLPSEIRDEQNKTIVIYTKNNFTNDITDDALHPDDYRLPLPSETKTFELKGITKTNSFYTPNDFTEILADTNSKTAEYFEIHKPPDPGKAQRRLIEHIRSTYYRNNLSGALPLHQLESLAIPFESYQLAYTPALLNNIFGAKVNAPLMNEGKFTNSEGDSNWWIRSGNIQFIEGAENDTNARDRFYVPISYTDPFGAKTQVNYYGNYFLFIEDTTDAFGNKSGVDKFNFRTLSPQKMKDINANVSEAIADELGLIKAIALLGKGNEADDITGLNEFTDVAERNLVNSFFNVPLTPLGVTDSIALSNIGAQLLQHATGRYVYDFDIYKKNEDQNKLNIANGEPEKVKPPQPVVIASIVREEHFSKNNNSPVQLSFEYSNGLGKVVMKKVQAKPGAAKKVIVAADNNYTVAIIDTTPLLRWIGNGRTIVNNKGNPVKSYEPYFSINNQYEDFKELVEAGVTPVMYYDAAGRLVKNEMPDGTFSKVEFDSWEQSVYDANDNILESTWYTNRTNRLIDARLIAEGKDPAREKVAADKAAKHANTPNVLHFDTLGRPVLSVDHNKNTTTDADEFYRTKVQLDAEGNLRSVVDAREIPENGNKGNTVMQYKYDMLGNLVYQKTMDSGQRWLLINIMGNPLRTWDERNHEFQYFYDALHRPTQSKVTGGDGAAPLDNIFDRIIYGESLLLPGRTNEAVLQAKNILGKPIQHFDTGGLSDTPEYDFKEQPLLVTRKLFKDYKSVANWIDAALNTDVEADDFTFSTETDALGRITKQAAPDGSIITPSYNEGRLLNSETVTHINPAVTTVYIKDIDYNEKGQRNKIIYGNDVSTKFYYDKETFRLKRLESKRQNNDPLQDWYYTFDAVGNITHIEDKNVPVVFFNNQKVTGLSEYTYDALYRLAEATGRENDAALNFNNSDNWNDASFINQLNTGDPMAIRNYMQSFRYDEVGNIQQMKHAAPGNNWVRNYAYEKNNNRLINTSVGQGANNFTLLYTHHPAHGFITSMPHLEEMAWSFKEELSRSVRQKRNDGGTPETTYYQYDGQGQRIRKITENAAGAGAVVTKKEERIYIAGYELYKKHSGADAGLERVSISLIDEGHRFVMIETRNNIDDGTDQHLVRYQLHNHIGSAAIELDNNAQIISYEEYHPFGTTAYQAKNSAIKSASKRYRYIGMERDEETGLEYHSARYYLPWLGRWLSADPIGIGDGVNVYSYCKGNPIKNFDITGKDTKEVERKDNYKELLRDAIEEKQKRSITSETLDKSAPFYLRSYENRNSLLYLQSSPNDVSELFAFKMELFGKTTVKLKDFVAPGWEDSAGDPAACYKLACAGVKSSLKEGESSSGGGGVILYEKVEQKIRFDKDASKLAVEQIKLHIDSGRGVLAGVNEPGHNSVVNADSQPVTDHFVAIYGYETDSHGKIIALLAKDNATTKVSEIRFIVKDDGSIIKPKEKRPAGEEYLQQEYQLSEVRFNSTLPYKGDLKPKNDAGQIMFWPNK